MNKEYYLNNWDKYWKSYADLNPDLAKHNIHSKRALYNHYNNRGYDEHRLVEVQTYIPPSISTKLILSTNMFKEKI